MASQSGSPGLVIPSAYDPLPGIAPNLSMLSAQSAGLIPNNVTLGQKSGTNLNNSLLTRSADFGANGYNGGVGGVFVGSVAAAGGAGPGAGGMNQTTNPSGGANFAIPAQVPASVIVGALAVPPVFGG